MPNLKKKHGLKNWLKSGFLKLSVSQNQNCRIIVKISVKTKQAFFSETDTYINASSHTGFSSFVPNKTLLWKTSYFFHRGKLLEDVPKSKHSSGVNFKTKSIWMGVFVNNNFNSVGKELNFICVGNVKAIKVVRIFSNGFGRISRNSCDGVQERIGWRAR